MASLFGFRARNPARDRETDRIRFMRLATLIDEMAGQISSERAGLQKRYGESSANAGFLMAALDNDEAAPASSTRLDTLTEEILNCERRLAALSRQLQLLDELRGQAEGLLDDARPRISAGDAA
jgi:hypothetical protein